MTPEVGKYLLQVENSRYLVPLPHRPYSSWQVTAHAITWLAPGQKHQSRAVRNVRGSRVDDPIIAAGGDPFGLVRWEQRIMRIGQKAITLEAELTFPLL